MTALISIPDVLGDDPITAETFFQQAAAHPQCPLDMAAVRFVRPYGVMAIVCAARAHYQHVGVPLHLVNLSQPIHQYLERADVLMRVGECLQIEPPLAATFDRTQPTPNLLELTPIADASAVGRVIAQAERIFSYWLPLHNLRRLLSVLSELCANLYQHSEDPLGMVLIQTYQAVSKGQVRVRLALGDLGVGIPHRYRRMGFMPNAAPLDHIYAALGGQTSRSNGRGGLGLRLVQAAIAEGGGTLWLRSETAGVLTDGISVLQARDDLPFMAGMQLAAEFHAPLPPM
ncbi:MAG: ATP-binding protein [Phototrophicaceae bacterium]